MLLKKNPDKDADFQAENHGSLWLLRPQDDAARVHLTENTSAESQWFGGALAVEPRYIDALVEGLESEGFTVNGY